MRTYTDLSGRHFGKLTVIGVCENSVAGKRKWLCKCECGNTSVVFGGNLTRGHTTSCGCHRDANYKTMNLTHGATANKMGDKSAYPSSYKIWCNMRQRCYDVNSPVYHYYGGRGITVCDRWNDYANFVADMGEKPKGLSLDRIDNDGPYSPENCRWTDMRTQQRNKRNAHLITYKGETKSVAEWADHIGVPRLTLQSRVFREWNVDRIFTQPYRNRPSRAICIANEQ